ncbi:hypothetical protein RTP6_000821 [Batrachochytrium dendrobatidis]
MTTNIHVILIILYSIIYFKAVKTLKLLYASHTRSGKELQRRIAQEASSSQGSVPLATAATSRQIPSPVSLPNPEEQLSTATLLDTNAGTTGTLPKTQSLNKNHHKMFSGLVAPNQPHSAAIHFYSGEFRGKHSPTSPIDPNASENRSEGSMLGSRQFFVGQSQTDSAMLPDRQSPFPTGSGTTSLLKPLSNAADYSGGGGDLKKASQGLPTDRIKTFATTTGASKPVSGRVLTGGLRDQINPAYFSNPATVPVKSLDKSDVMLESIANSYLVLDDNAKEIRKSVAPDDPFNKFWESVERLVGEISLSGPVAFATAPLHDGQRSFQGIPAKPLQSSQHNSTMQKTFIRTIETQADSSDTQNNTGIMQSYLLVSPDMPFDSDASGTLNQTQQALKYHGLVDTPFNQIQGNTGSYTNVRLEDVCSSISGKKTLEEYRIENNHLKQIVDKLTQQMVHFERAADENTILKSSILQLRSDVQKHAKRYYSGTMNGNSMYSSVMQNFVGAGLSQGSLGSSQKSADLAMSVSQESDSNSSTMIKGLKDRIAHLENELTVVKSELEQQNLVITKYRERWDKLKESTKKKKESRSYTDLMARSLEQNSHSDNSLLTSTSTPLVTKPSCVDVEGISKPNAAFVDGLLQSDSVAELTLKAIKSEPALHGSASYTLPDARPFSDTTFLAHDSSTAFPDYTTLDHHGSLCESNHELSDHIAQSSMTAPSLTHQSLYYSTTLDGDQSKFDEQQ